MGIEEGNQCRIFNITNIANSSVTQVNSVPTNKVYQGELEFSASAVAAAPCHLCDSPPSQKIEDYNITIWKRVGMKHPSLPANILQYLSSIREKERFG